VDDAQQGVLAGRIEIRRLDQDTFNGCSVFAFPGDDFPAPQLQIAGLAGHGCKGNGGE
jgi:hypothetical protein